MNLPVFLALRCLAIVLFLPLACRAEATDAEPSAEQVRAGLLALRFKGEFPALTGFSRAQPIELAAPSGDHSHTTAYRSAAGCVAFFLPLSPTHTDVELKWVGDTKCNGKPIEGRGTLSIKRKIREGADSVTVVVGVLQGSFRSGMLTGKAEKANFTYSASGKPLDDTYQFFGEFANSVLHGQGEARWSGAENAEPSAWSKRGTFHNGVITGTMRFGRLHPTPGVEAVMQNTVVNKDGGVYINQAYQNGREPIKGLIFFANDPVEWKVDLVNLGNGAGDMPESARLRRYDPQLHRTFDAACTKWEFRVDRLVCPTGNVTELVPRMAFVAQDKPFSIPLPMQEQGVGFRVQAGEQVLVGNPSAAAPMKCNEDISACDGDALIVIERTRLYWYGPSTFRKGVLRPIAGALYDSRQGMDPKQDTVVAKCEKFASPTRCARGTTLNSKDSSFEGAWTLDGATFGTTDTGRSYYVADRQIDLVPEGWGVVTFSNRDWAEVKITGGDMTQVGRCGHSLSDDVTCTLEGQTVVFTDRRVKEQEPDRVIPVEPFRWPETEPPPRFKPTPIPTRPVYVLPGSR